MGIVDDVNVRLKDAMRAKDKDQLRALRGIRAAFLEAMKKDGSETLTDDACLAILARLAKARRESIVAYTEGGRPEMAAEEQVELDIIEAFLPKLADEETVRGWVREAIASTGAASMADMGKVMGALMAAHKAEIDGKTAQTIVKELLG